MQNHNSITFIQENYILLLIVLLGAILRLYNLSGESLWHDEAVTSKVAGLTFTELISWIANTNDNNPPLYYLLMHFWVSVFGHSEFSLRFPSAVFGTGSIFMIYLVGRQLLSRSTSLIAALILAVSVFNIEYSQEARTYSLLAFLTLCSFYFYLKLLGSSKSLFTVGYIVASVLLLYTHFYAVFVIMVQNVFCFTRYFQRRDVFSVTISRWILLQLIIGFLFIPGLVIWYKNAAAIQSGFWLYEPTVIDLARYFYHFSGRNYILFFVFLILAAFSFIDFKKVGHSNNIKDMLDIEDNTDINRFFSKLNTKFLLLLWLCIPILIPFLISLVSTPILHTRYIIGSSLALYILVAWGICNLHNKKLTVIIPLVILLLSIWPLYIFYKEAHKHDWRGTISYLENNADRNDKVFVYPTFDMMTTAYYKKREDISYMPLRSESLGELPERFWVVIGQFSKVEEKTARDVILGGYDLVPIKSFNRLKLYRYEKK